MKDRIDLLKSSFEEKLLSAGGKDDLEAIRIEYLGKKGHVASLMAGLRDAADKKTAGMLINIFKNEVEGAITKRQEELRQAELEAKIRSAKKYNPSLRFE
ncbi:MAG: hypothetical protein IJF38_04400, partial [Clostridia bacterium]|nr:hypothetical protein [Clostridia bacterium]